MRIQLEKLTILVILLHFLVIALSQGSNLKIITFGGSCTHALSAITDAESYLFQSAAKGAEEFATFSRDLEAYVDKLKSLNPNSFFKFRRSAEDEISILFSTPDDQKFGLKIGAGGNIVGLFAENSHFKFPMSVDSFFKTMHLKLPESKPPSITRSYTPVEVQKANTLLASKQNDPKTVKTTIWASDESEKQVRIKLKSIAEQDSTVLESEILQLNLLREKYQSTQTEKDRQSLATQIAKINSMRLATEETRLYSSKLNSAEFHKALQKKLASFDHVIFSHGQPSWVLKETIKSGELSSPAMRGLIEGTDCGSANICVGMHNVQGPANPTIAFNYAGGGSSLHSPGTVFLMRPSPLDNFPGQPATRNVLFRHGNSDGRLVKILVPSETLPEVKKWLNDEKLDPSLAEDYLDFVAGHSAERLSKPQITSIENTLFQEIANKPDELNAIFYDLLDTKNSAGTPTIPLSRQQSLGVAFSHRAQSLSEKERKKQEEIFDLIKQRWGKANTRLEPNEYDFLIDLVPRTLISNRYHSSRLFEKIAEQLKREPNLRKKSMLHPDLVASSTELGLNGLTVYHGTSVANSEKVRLGPKNISEGFGGKGLYLAFEGDYDYAEGYAIKQSRGFKNPHVVMEGKLNPNKELRVLQVQAAGINADTFTGNFPLEWSNNKVLQEYILENYDALLFHIPDGTLNNGQFLVVTERAGPDAILWSK